MSMSKKLAVAIIVIFSLSSCSKVDSVLDAISSVLNIISLVRGCSSEKTLEINVESTPKAPKSLPVNVYINDIFVASIKNDGNNHLKLSSYESYRLRLEMKGYETVKKEFTKWSQPQVFNILLEKVITENRITCKKIKVLANEHALLTGIRRRLVEGDFFTLVNSSGSDLYDVSILPMAFFSDGYKAGLKEMFVGKWKSGKTLDIRDIHNRFIVDDNIEKYIFDLKFKKRKSRFVVYDISNECDNNNLIFEISVEELDRIGNTAGTATFYTDWVIPFLNHLKR